MSRITLNVILRNPLRLRPLIGRRPGNAVPGHSAVHATRTASGIRSRATRLGRRHSLLGRRLDEFRSAFDRIVFAHIAAAEADPTLDVRTDVLALLVRARLADKAGISCVRDLDELIDADLCRPRDHGSRAELVFERLRRHPDVLAELVREADAGGYRLRRAAIAEVLRSRTVIDVAGRRGDDPRSATRCVASRTRSTVLVRIADLHDNEEVFAHPNGMTRSGSAVNRGLQRDWPSAVACGAVSGPTSRRPRWRSCCGSCCRTSGFTPTRWLTRSRPSTGSPTSQPRWPHHGKSSEVAAVPTQLIRPSTVRRLDIRCDVGDAIVANWPCISSCSSGATSTAPHWRGHCPRR